MRIDIDFNGREILLIELALDQLKRKGVGIGLTDSANEQWNKDLEELIERYHEWLECEKNKCFKK